MKPQQILELLEEYYLQGGTRQDLDIVLDYLQELDSLSYFYWITKQWEECINKNSAINENTFQTLMIKWFTDCLELQFSKV